MKLFLFGALALVFSLSALAADPKPAPLDPAAKQICEDLIKLRQKNIYDIKESAKTAEETLAIARPKLQDLMNDLSLNYKSDTQSELRSTAKKYAELYKAVSESTLPDADKKELLDTVNSDIGAKITTAFQKSSSLFDMNQRFQTAIQPLFSPYLSNGSCTVSNGQALVCFSCNALAQKPLSSTCEVSFGLDLATGEVFVKNPPASDAEARIKTVYEGYNLPKVCKDLWVQERDKPFTPPVVATSANHGSPSGRPESNQVSKTVKSVKLSFLDTEGLLVGSTDTKEGREAIAQGISGANNPNNTPMIVDIVGILRAAGQNFDKTEGHFGDAFFSNYSNPRCNSAYTNNGSYLTPMKLPTKIEALAAIYPEFKGRKMIPLAELRAKVLEVTQAKSLTFEAKLRQNFSEFTIKLESFDAEGNKLDTWEPSFSFTYSDYSNTGFQTQIGLAGAARAAGKTVSSPYFGYDDAFSDVVLGHVMADILFNKNPQKIEAFVKAKNEECEKFVAEQDTKLLKDLEEKLNVVGEQK